MFRGFMCVTLKACGVVLHFKTLNLLEIRSIMEISHALPAHRTFIPYLIYSLYRLEGVNVLSDRESNYEELTHMFEHFRPAQQRYFMQILNVLNARAIAEMDKLVPFTYGSRSKLLWSAYKDQMLCDTSVTGLEGTQTLGLNETQKTWIHLNRIEDQTVHFETEYDLAKFIVSPHTKDIKKINDQDKTRRDEQNEHKAKTNALGRDSGWGEGKDRHIIDQSVDELMSQITRTVRGEKDLHDMIVEQHLTKVRNQQVSAQKERTDRMNIARANMDRQIESEGEKPALIRPLTLAEVDAEIQMRLKKRHEYLSSRPDAEESSNQERDDATMDKWGFSHKDPPSSFEQDYIRDLSNSED